jgi:hypothetical protein
MNLVPPATVLTTSADTVMVMLTVLVVDIGRQEKDKHKQT